MWKTNPKSHDKCIFIPYDLHMFLWVLQISLAYSSAVLIFQFILTLINSLSCCGFSYQTHAEVLLVVDFVACGLVESVMWSHTSQISVLPSGQTREAWKNLLIHSGRITKSIHYASLRPPDPPDAFMWSHEAREEPDSLFSFLFYQSEIWPQTLLLQELVFLRSVSFTTEETRQTSSFRPRAFPLNLTHICRVERRFFSCMCVCNNIRMLWYSSTSV